MRYRIFEQVLNEQVIYGATEQWRMVDEVEGNSFEEARIFALARNPFLQSMSIDDGEKTRIELHDVNKKLDMEEINRICKK